MKSTRTITCYQCDQCRSTFGEYEAAARMSHARVAVYSSPPPVYSWTDPLLEAPPVAMTIREARLDFCNRDCERLWLAAHPR